MVRFLTREWTLRPTFHHRPLQKQAAIIWIVAHLVAYRLQTQRRLSLTGYMDFLRRARCKEYHRASKTPTVGRYPSVLEFAPPHQHQIRLKPDYKVIVWHRTSLDSKHLPTPQGLTTAGGDTCRVGTKRSVRNMSQPQCG